MSKKLRYIDLFSGCGGWSEGFSQLGYECVYSVDNWSPAAQTHAYNHPGIKDDDKAKDILSDEVFHHIKKLLKSGKADVLIGSPPCTQFSFANRGGKGNTVEGMVLVRRYLELINYIQKDLGHKKFPWVLENVPRMKDFLDKERVSQDENLYQFNYIDRPNEFYEIEIPQIVVLNSADFGAPQKRNRVFCGNFNIPMVTNISSDILNNEFKLTHFCDSHNISKSKVKKLKPWRTLRDVLTLLPDPKSNPKSSKKIKDPNYDIQLTQKELNDHFYDTRIENGLELYESHELKQHHSIYGVMNFPDDLDSPARTIMATEMRVSRETIIVPLNIKTYKNFTGKKSYAQILKEIKNQDTPGFRRLTIREVACVQGFPITYQFYGESSGVKHKQVGNAVSPFISRAFAEMFLTFPNEQKKKKKLILKKNSDISFNKTESWKFNPHLKKQMKFSKHLRSTKSEGERIDLEFKKGSDSTWNAMLCIGSGKSYEKIELTREFIIGSLNQVENGNALFNKTLRKIPKFLISIEKETKKLDLKHFYDFDINSYFTKTGNYKANTPLYFVEEGIDKTLRNILKKDYDIVKSLKTEESIKIAHLRKRISFYTLLASFTTLNLVENINRELIDV